MRTSAFGGASVRSGAAAQRSACVARCPVVVKAVQDVQGTVVSTAMKNTVVVATERLAPHDKVRNCERGDTQRQRMGRLRKLVGLKSGNL